uniref:Uncharacterized protein n=1 Tax=viral metagenome TaxID=1070528 RepID=A0A6C0HHE6_9ZZZZ
MGLKKSAASVVKKTYYKALNNYSAKLAGSKSLLYNKYVLYISFVVCLINLLIWLFSGEFIHVAVFLLVGYLTSFFSKNMIVILVIALVVSNLFKSGFNIVLEGMENNKKTDEPLTNGDGIYHPKDKKEGMKPARGKKEGMKNGKHGKKEGMKSDDDHEGLEEHERDHEGLDDQHEGMDGDGDICTSDKDCKNGHRCNDSKMCELVK